MSYVEGVWKYMSCQTWSGRNLDLGDYIIKDHMMQLDVQEDIIIRDVATKCTETQTERDGTKEMLYSNEDNVF